MGKKITTEEFIEKAKNIHNFLYDYSETVYINSFTKLKIICEKHGPFEQRPNDHIQKKSGCPKCKAETLSKIFSSNKEKFIIKAHSVHKNKYDYSLVQYTNNKTKVKITCSKHGVFEQRPDCHLNGNGCPLCGTQSMADQCRDTFENFTLLANKKHNSKYCYVLAAQEYKNREIKIPILCPCHEHGIFWLDPHSHLRGRGCPKCITVSYLDSFILKAIETHGNKYDYSKSNYSTRTTKVVIICPKHGKFKQTPNDHLKGCGCPKCSLSHLERLVNVWLEKQPFNYMTQVKFDGLVDVKPLIFDFVVVLNNNTLLAIECQGEGHYKPIKRGKRMTLKKANIILQDIQKKDQIKRDWCINSNNVMFNQSQYKTIQLLEIPYWEKKNIELILNKALIA